MKTKKKKSHFRWLRRLIIGLLTPVLIIFIIYSVIAFNFIGKVNIIETAERTEPSHEIYSSSSVRNILLIGTDSRGKDRGRSDSMIILSINSSTDKMTIVSLMRDTYVQIPGHGGAKLNAAYQYGGAELLMDTIEENFYIEVDEYFTVNFTSFANIVDTVGGVEMEISDAEADAINVLLDSKEGKTLFGTPDESDYLHGGGTYVLNGKQALCYSRLRKVGNADFERTERQRNVLQQIMKNIVSEPTSIFSNMGSILGELETNMSKMSMYFLSLRLPFLLTGYEFEQMRIPAENAYTGTTINGQSVLEFDKAKTLDMIENDLY